jgi:hypothetical protein
MNALWKASSGVLVTILLFCIWYSIAANFGYEAVSGTYTLRQNGEASTLILRPDHTFHQDLLTAERSEQAEGSWYRIGEGGIRFSKEFLKATGQETEPDGTTVGQVKKTIGLFVRIELNANPVPGAPTFHKRLFR